MSLLNKNMPVIAGYDPIVDMGINYSNEIDFGCIELGDSVLHIGCGTGDYTFTIRGIVADSGRVIGIDISDDNVALARQNCGYFGYNNVTFFQKDIANLQFGDASFDVVVCNYALNLFPNKEQIYKEFHRVLKPNGKLIIADAFVVGDVQRDALDAIVASYYKMAKLPQCDNVIVNAQGEMESLLINAGFKSIVLANERDVDVENGEMLLYLPYDMIDGFVNSGCSIRLVNEYGTK
ncbi:MAG: methyltransferase domain-containing protein [Ignavibacteria bacterium]|jgi:ubiquinone/menaquinone biosynthesis C-methylase UbiE|nr:methyltransferase domain-containing protein [Ignavibacteria bacterium]